jgi:hypothetical protein
MSTWKSVALKLLSSHFSVRATRLRYWWLSCISGCLTSLSPCTFTAGTEPLCQLFRALWRHWSRPSSSLNRPALNSHIFVCDCTSPVFFLSLFVSSWLMLIFRYSRFNMNILYKSVRTVKDNVKSWQFNLASRKEGEVGRKTKLRQTSLL